MSGTLCLTNKNVHVKIPIICLYDCRIAGGDCHHRRPDFSLDTRRSDKRVKPAGDRTCTNNLKQIGLAYQCYESAYHVLPPAYISDKDKPMGWGIYLLPYIEMKTMYDQYNFRAALL